VVFSTSPTATYTHWKQTVFYLEEPITMKQDETVTATITCAPNSANARDLDIAIDYRYDTTDDVIDVFRR
jgi:protein arginine N-methyltransferase 1